MYTCIYFIHGGDRGHFTSPSIHLHIYRFLLHIASPLKPSQGRHVYDITEDEIANNSKARGDQGACAVFGHKEEKVMSLAHISVQMIEVPEVYTSRTGRRSKI